MSVPRPALGGARRARLGALALLAAMVGAAGCAGDSNSGTGSGGSGGATTGTGGTSGTGGSGMKDSSTDCTLRTDLDVYAANMTKKGKNNLMSFQIVESKPAPPARADNDFTVKVTTMGGMPVTQGLKVRVSMPEHGHDSPDTPTITPDTATSTYNLFPVNMKIMGGVWRVTLTVADPTDSQIIIDNADFDFCIP